MRTQPVLPSVQIARLADDPAPFGLEPRRAVVLGENILDGGDVILVGSR